MCKKPSVCGRGMKRRGQKHPRLWLTICCALWWSKDFDNLSVFIASPSIGGPGPSSIGPALGAIAVGGACLLLPLRAVTVWGSHDKVIRQSSLPGSLWKSLLLSDFTPLLSLHSDFSLSYAPSPVICHRLLHLQPLDLQSYLESLSVRAAIFGSVMWP